MRPEPAPNPLTSCNSQWVTALLRFWLSLLFLLATMQWSLLHLAQRLAVSESHCFPPQDYDLVISHSNPAA